MLRRHALSAIRQSAAAEARRFQIHRSALLHAQSLRSLLSRETLDCRIPSSFFSLVTFFSNSSKPSSDADLLRIIEEDTKCEDHDRVEMSWNTISLTRNFHVNNNEALASGPFLEGMDELSNDRMSFKLSKESSERMLPYEGDSFRQEDEVECPQKWKQKERRQGERFHLLKSRGQHILTNPRILDSIVRKAEVLPTDTVLEIGPGTGNLTIRLLKCAKKVIAVEIDERMVDALQNRVAKLGLEDKLDVIIGNALKMEFPHFDLCVANIPYGISSPLIAKLFVKPLKSCFRSATLLLQKEFAHRLLAKPGDSDFNRLAVNVGLVASVDFLMNVSKKEFVPCPKVDSSLVRIQPKLNVAYVNIDEWLGFTRTCFGQRNKTLGAIFKQKRKITELYENSKSNCINIETFRYGDGASDYDVDDNNVSDDSNVGSSSLELEEENSAEILLFKEKIVGILKEEGFGEKRPSKLSNEDFLCLLQLFNKEGVFFH